MPMWDASKVYIDPILSRFAKGWNEQTLYAQELFAETPVQFETGIYRVFDRSNWLVFDDARAPGTASNEVRGAVYSQDTFRVHEHSLQAAVTWEEQRNAARGNNPVGQNINTNLAARIDPMRDATTLVTRAIRLRYELMCSTVARTLANYPAGNKVTNVGTAQWNDYGGTAPAYNSKPVDDIITGVRQVESVIGQPPNVMFMPWDVGTYLRNHPQVVDRFKYFELTNDDAFTQLTGFAGRIVITNSRYNTADNPALGESLVKFWGKDVILAYIDPGELASENTMTWAKGFWFDFDGQGLTMPVDRWTEVNRKSDIVRVTAAFDVKIVTPEAAYIIQNAVA